jgi:hypothetical protein
VEIVCLWGPVTGRTAEAFARALDHAEVRKARAVFIDLDSPGGERAAAVRMLDAVAAHPDLRFLVYVDGRHYGGAWGAAALVALAAGAPLMRPGSVFSFAAPGMNTEGEDVNIPLRLTRSQTVRLRALGERMGFSPAAMAALADPEGDVWHLADDDGRSLTADEYAALPPARRADARRVKVRGAALSLTAEEAAGLGLATLGEEAAVPEALGLEEEKQVGAFRFDWDRARRDAAQDVARQKKLIANVRTMLQSLDLLRRRAREATGALSIRSSPAAVEAGRDAVRRLGRAYGALIKAARRLPHLGLDVPDFVKGADAAEAGLAELDALAALLPDVKQTEYGGASNVYGFQPVYTFEAEDHLDGDRAREIRDPFASRDVAALLRGRTDRERMVRIRPGGLPGGLYVARFHMKVSGALRIGEVELTVDAGPGSGALIVDEDVLRRHEAQGGYLPFDVTFAPYDRPIEIAVTVERARVLVDKIEVWRRDDLFPPVLRTEEIAPRRRGEPRRDDRRWNIIIR